MVSKKKLHKLKLKGDRKKWKEVRLEILKRDGECLVCGCKKGEEYINKKGKITKVKLDVHHLLEKEFIIFHHLKFDKRNLVTLCSICHKFGPFSIHRNPLYVLDIIKKKYPKNYRFLLNECRRLNGTEKK
jgi:5-methylcytosine-specific restriction endonuclease McrA